MGTDTITVPRLIGTKALMAYLDIRDMTTLTRMAERGELPKPKRLGRRNFWVAEEVMNHLGLGGASGE
jgi:predicted DNA-binding transcriptional regulator AlpA